ncbi:hypothetical protein GQF03_02555 [Sneathiella chungangensis]|uniref:Uncharacterized protein n=1 Tax=Sneathiella chungangensis TaxID=1418234 RepID=A0A845MDR9_9PROT|nr:hypothetical protein [Sneathiella chungangensis]MZR21204.1 hypothetical protein [Sneathiella chungangensis]
MTVPELGDLSVIAGYTFGRIEIEKKQARPATMQAFAKVFLERDLLPSQF